MHPLLAPAVSRLSEAGAPTETRVVALRGALGRTKLRIAGEVWRLGALCLSAEGDLYATGDVLVVSDPTHPNHRSAVALERNELRGLLRRAGVPVGATAIVDALPLSLEDPTLPLVPLGDGLGVLWTAGGSPIPVERYLTERADLLLHPPERA